MGLEHTTDGQKREVGEVLVIDRVPLVVLDQAHQVGELHRDHAPGLQQDLHAGHEVVEVGDVREHVVARAAGRRLIRLPANGQSPGRRTQRAWGCPSAAPPSPHSPPARSRARGSDARGRTAAGNRRWKQSRRRGCPRPDRDARPSARSSGGCAPASSRSRTRSRRSRRRSARASRTPPAAPGSTSRRRARAAGRTAPCCWPARAADRSSQAATYRGPRRRLARERRRIDRGFGS